MSLKAHEHFCARCYPKNGGWYRCVDPKCVKPQASVCREHDSIRVNGSVGDARIEPDG